METFKLEFTYDHHRRTAEVTVQKHPNHIQYTIAPEDPELKEKFATQVIHRFDDELQFAFPNKGQDAEKYNAAIDKALKRLLKIEQ